MAVLIYPNPALDQIAEPVEPGERCREIVDSMFAQMDFPRGIGIAAPQIGVNKRIICVQVPNIKNGKMVAGTTKFHVINPEMFWFKGEMVLDWEGCLSFPETRVLVPRYPRVKVRGYDVRWRPVTFGGKGLVARVIQHELDHLNGRTLQTYVDIQKQLEAEKTD